MDKRLNCSVGDLAIIVRAEVALNLGQLVVVVSHQEIESGLAFSDEGHVWMVKTVSGRRSLNYFKDGALFAQLAYGPVPDSRLRPIAAPEDDKGCNESLSITCQRSFGSLEEQEIFRRLSFS